MSAWVADFRSRWLARREARDAALPVRDRVDLGSARPARLLAFDQTLVVVVGVLVALGVVMVYSASIALPDSKKFEAYTQAFFLQRHVLALAIGFVAALCTLQVPMSVWENFRPGSSCWRWCCWCWCWCPSSARW